MNKPSNKKSERFAGIILISLLFGVIAVGSIWFYLHKTNTPKTIPIETALYVSNYDITKIYGPGTPQQATILKKLKLNGNQTQFNSYVLYRMGADSGDTDEGILMLGFDPANPETAHQLKSAP